MRGRRTGPSVVVMHTGVWTDVLVLMHHLSLTLVLVDVDHGVVGIRAVGRPSDHLLCGSHNTVVPERHSWWRLELSEMMLLQLLVVSVQIVSGKGFQPISLLSGDILPMTSNELGHLLEYDSTLVTSQLLEIFFGHEIF